MGAGHPEGTYPAWCALASGSSSSPRRYGRAAECTARKRGRGRRRARNRGTSGALAVIPAVEVHDLSWRTTASRCCGTSTSIPAGRLAAIIGPNRGGEVDAAQVDPRSGAAGQRLRARVRRAAEPRCVDAWGYVPQRGRLTGTSRSMRSAWCSRALTGAGLDPPPLAPGPADRDAVSRAGPHAGLRRPSDLATLGRPAARVPRARWLSRPICT